ncbi:MAG TPA: hypothetical protein VMB21_20520 [Candidatus Limnocylindria bacterium]|nr:hypothetical protein [Candidatus Limnocylindria bacterium]
MSSAAPLLPPPLPLSHPAGRRRREPAPVLRLVPAERPTIELVYGGTRLLAVMVAGRPSVETTLKLLKLIPRSRHDKLRAKRWGLDLLFHDPQWAVPEERPVGQRVVFL